MNFGIAAPSYVMILLIVWCLPIIAAVWFHKTIAGMAGSLREIAARLQALEGAVRDAAARGAPPGGR